MKTKPLVSIICLCYNQVKFVEETLASVWNQTYENIQLIIVDDCSTDGSKRKIESLIKNKSIPFLSLASNLGSTKAFNKGLELAQGKYVIDLAADDVLDKNRVESQIAFFESCDETIGIVYSDAMYISEIGQKLFRHFSNKKLISHTGDVYIKLIEKYFIPTPSMMIRKSVFDELNGYDENLTFEDFDFWIRSSRKWKYAYQDKALTFVRKSKNSFSTKAYVANSRQVYDIYLICDKIKNLNKSNAENEALKKRLRYEIRQASFSGFHSETQLFYDLLKGINGTDFISNCLILLNRLKLNLSSIRNLYQRIRYS